MQLNESLRIKRLVFGTDENLSLAETMNEIGLIYHKKANFDSALMQLNESLRIKRLVFGTDENLSTAETMNEIGLIYHKKANFDLALKYYKSSLYILRSFYNDSQLITDILNNIQSIYYKQ